MSPPLENEARDAITLRLGDILSRIPAQFLKPGAADPQRELRFPVEELMKGIARGRPAVPLQQIAALCPEIFHDELALAEGIEIQLPLQKVVEQVAGASAPRPRRTTEAGAPVRGRSAAAPARTAGSGRISLNLAAIFRLLPHQITGHASMPDEKTRIELPLRLIEPQLSTGHVEIPFPEFVSALPRELAAALGADGSEPVWIPLDEVFQNLPEEHPFYLGLRSEEDGESLAPATPRLDLPEGDSCEQPIAETMVRLPEVIGCVVYAQDRVGVAGDLWPDLDLVTLRAKADALQNGAGDLADPLGFRGCLTLDCDHGFLTIHRGARAMICVFHRPRSLPPPVHHALAAAVGATA